MDVNCAVFSDEEDESFQVKQIKNSMNFNYEWITSASNIDDFPQSCESDIFCDQTNTGIKWRFNMEKIEGTKYHVRLTLLVSNNIDRILSDCMFILKSKSSKHCIVHKPQVEFTVGNNLCCGFDVEMQNFLPPSGNLNQEFFKIICVMDVLETHIIFTRPKCTLRYELDRMFKNKKFSDVTLCASDQEFQAHKAILAARSPVFEAMFDHDMEEKKTNRINITDIDGEVLEELLRFIYTGQVSNLENHALDLLAAADKYQIETLKQICQKSLYKNISVENASDVLVLAEMHSLPKLKFVSLEYIICNAADVSKTDGWKLLVRTCPDLAGEVFHRLAHVFDVFKTCCKDNSLCGF